MGKHKYERVEKVPNLLISYDDMLAFKHIPPDEKDTAWRAVMAYFDAARVIDAGEERPEPPQFHSEISSDFYASMTEKIEKDCLRYWEKCNKNRENRQQVDKQSTSSRPVVDQSSTNSRPVVDQSFTNTIQYNTMQNKNNPPPIIPPTEEEIIAYCKEEKNGIGREEAKRFYKVFSGQGWRDRNGNPVKDWKILISTWTKETESTTAQKYSNQRAYTEEELLAASEDLIAEAANKRN